MASSPISHGFAKYLWFFRSASLGLTFIFFAWCRNPCKRRASMSGLEPEKIVEQRDLSFVVSSTRRKALGSSAGGGDGGAWLLGKNTQRKTSCMRWEVGSKSRSSLPFVSKTGWQTIPSFFSTPFRSATEARPCFGRQKRENPLTAQYGGGSVASFSLRSDGSLDTKTGLIDHAGGSKVVKDRQDASHAHWTGFSPDNRFAFVPTLASMKWSSIS